MRLSVPVLLILLLKGMPADAQLKISGNGSPLSPENIVLRFVLRDGIDISTHALNSISPTEWQPFTNKQVLPLKKTEQSFWVTIPLSKLPPSSNWLVVKDPHINQLGVWFKKGDSIFGGFAKTGDHEPFSSRSIAANDFVFPLPQSPSDSLELIIGADKRHTRTLLPIAFLSDQRYLQESKERALTNGILIGLVLVIFIYNTGLYLLIRQHVFLWYSLYLFLILLYFLSDMGYLFQYLHPNLPQVNDVLRVGIIAGSIIPFILFFNSLLELKKNMPQFHRINIGVMFLFTTIFVAGTSAAAVGSFPQQQAWLHVYSILSPCILLLLTAESVCCIIRKIPFSKYTTCSLVSFLAMAALFIGHEKGILPDHFIIENAFYLGISMEIFIMTMAIAARFNSFRKTSESLLLEKNARQEDILKTVSQFKEQEMQRFSNMLHDTVGAKLSAIRMNLDAIGPEAAGTPQSAQIHEVAREVSSLADEVRNFSHELSPLLLQKNGLVSTIRQLVETINRTGRIRILFESIGSLQSVSFAQEILLHSILQELINNIIRHAGAKSAIIQLLLNQEVISINVEDDGKGFDPKDIREGLGFIQIRKLVAFVSGQFALDASPGKGCRISIEFKNTEHAGNN
jgi:signal transduction histidine kinase